MLPDAVSLLLRRQAIKEPLAVLPSLAIPGSFQSLLMTCEADPSNSRIWEVLSEDVGWVRPAMT